MLLLFALILSLQSFASSYEILGLFPFPAKSHYAVFDPLMVALAERGHNVTVYNTFPKPYLIPNYHEVDISHCFHLPNILTIPEMQAAATNGFATVDLIFPFMPSYEEIKNCAVLLNLINSTHKYDLLITETFNTDFFLLFSNVLNIPVIGFHSNAPLTWLAENNGLPYNPSYIPNYIGDFPPRMNFLQRTENLLLNFYSWYTYKTRSLDVFDDMAKEIFASRVPPLEKVARNASMLFLYTHFSFNCVRPVVPNVIEIAGLNIKEAKPLEKVRRHGYFLCDLQSFIVCIVEKGVKVLSIFVSYSYQIMSNIIH